MTSTTDQKGARIALMLTDITGITAATNDWDGYEVTTANLPYVVVMEQDAEYTFPASGMVTEIRQYFLIVHGQEIDAQVSRLDTSARDTLRGLETAIVKHFANASNRRGFRAGAGIDEIADIRILASGGMGTRTVRTRHYSSVQLVMAVTSRYAGS